LDILKYKLNTERMDGVKEKKFVEMTDEELMDMVGGCDTEVPEEPTLPIVPLYGVVLKYGVHPLYGITPKYGIVPVDPPVAQPMYGIKITDIN
jgi:hypothetical protein